LRDAFRRQIAVIREGPIYGSMICAVAGMVVMAQIVEGLWRRAWSPPL
jgi:hypothetical protein